MLSETTEPREPLARRQAAVNAFFTRQRGYWRRVYEERTLAGLIYQWRRAAAHAWIDELELPEGTHILDVGCGAGLTVVDLARSGYRVSGIDASAAMLELARSEALGARVSDRVSLGVGDVHALPFADGSQGCVIALGLVPWLHSPAAALAEMARVLQPGGFLLLSSDNRLRLSHLLDPLQLPLLQPLKSLIKWIARALGHERPRSLGSFMTYGALARLLSSVGFVPLRRQTFGFGPFTVFRRPLLSEAAGMRLHLRLQALADRGVPLLRVTGAQDLVLARRS